MDKRFVGILAAIIIVLAGIFAFSQRSSNKNGGGSSNNSPSHHVEGSGAKHVTLLEYGDYECPVCGAYYQPLKDVVAKYNADIYFQFKNLPLTAIHQNAFAGARAAEAAGMQNKYWEMHDALYENQNAWVSQSNPVAAFDVYAKDIGLNVAQFDADYKSDKVNNAINSDLADFAKTGQQQETPSIFLDGKFVPYASMVDSSNSPSAERIGALVQAEIAKKNP